VNVVTTPEGRWYEKDGEWLISVTTVIGRYLDIAPKDEEARARWDKLGERGTRIHELLAQPSISLAEWNDLPVDVRNALHARQRFVVDYGFKREDCEMALGNIELGFAGRLDDAGRIPAGRIIIDYKSGRLRPRSLKMQLGAYYGLYVAMYPRRKVFGALGVALSPANGTYTVESLSLGDLKRGLAEFKEALYDTNQRTIGDQAVDSARQDSSGN